VQLVGKLAVLSGLVPVEWVRRRRTTPALFAQFAPPLAARFSHSTSAASTAHPTRPRLQRLSLAPVLLSLSLLVDELDALAVE